MAMNRRLVGLRAGLLPSSAGGLGARTGCAASTISLPVKCWLGGGISSIFMSEEAGTGVAARLSQILEGPIYWPNRCVSQTAICCSAFRFPKAETRGVAEISRNAMGSTDHSTICLLPAHHHFYAGSMPATFRFLKREAESKKKKVFRIRVPGGAKATQFRLDQDLIGLLGRAPQTSREFIAVLIRLQHWAGAPANWSSGCCTFSPDRKAEEDGAVSSKPFFFFQAKREGR